MKVGLTGSYLSGHDKAMDIFRKMGVPVFDADMFLTYIINRSDDHKRMIRHNLPNNFFIADTIDLHCFKKNNDFDRLLDLVEFDILKAYEKFRIENINSYYTIFKYSYIFERGLNESMSKVIYCHKERDIRKRYMSLLFPDFIDTDKILKDEFDQDVKLKLSDLVIGDKKSIQHSVHDQIIFMDSYLKKYTLSCTHA
jgi:dephospho-CoA kinase